MKFSDIIPGMYITVNGYGDLCMDKNNYKWVGKQCEVIKITKAGLISVKLVDNSKLIRSFALSNIDPWPI